MKPHRAWSSALLCALCVLCGERFSLSLDREAFTFARYDLDVRVEPDQQRLAVRGKLTVRNYSNAPQADLALQVSSSLDWRSIRIAGKPVQFVTHEYTSDIDHTGALSEAVVSLPHPVPPQSTVEMEIGYEGTIPLDVTRLTRIGVPEGQARHTDWDQIGKSFSAVRGIGYVVWYPVATEAASLSDGNGLQETIGRWKDRESAAEFTLQLTVTKEAGGSAPEILVNAKDCKGQPRQAVQCDFAPLGIMVPSFVLGNYRFLERPTAAIRYLPEHQAGAETYALAVELSAPLVTEWFGAPREKAAVVELADPDDAPFESGSMLLTPLGISDSRPYMLGAVHQLTHAAFFSPRPWIFEGLAHFAQALEREQQNGRQAGLEFMEQHRPAITVVEKTNAAEHGQNLAARESLINTSAEEFYRSKAMYVWWMLRDMLGESTLKKGLAAYHSDQDKEAAYMQKLLEAQSHRDLAWFFDDWLYRDRGLPDFQVESAYPRATVTGGFVVTVTVENLGNAGAEVPVALRLEGGGEVVRRLEVRAKSKASVRIEAATAPLEVVVNGDGSVPENDMNNNRYKLEPVSH